jgi:hypothetical protein
MEGSRSTVRRVGEMMAAANEAAEVEHGATAVYGQDDEGGGRRPVGRRRFRWGAGTLLFAVLCLGAFTLLQLHPFRGPRGDRLLLYFLMDGDGWELVFFSIGGLLLFAAAICLVPPPVNKIPRTLIRRTLKGLLGLLMTLAVACWVLGMGLLFIVASTWNYATFSAPDGRQVLIGWQSYGVGVWTPYAGPLYERRRELTISDLEAVIDGKCLATSENSVLMLRCGSDSIRIPEAS